LIIFPYEHFKDRSELDFQRFRLDDLIEAGWAGVAFRGWKGGHIGRTGLALAQCPLAQKRAFFVR
jgi:hypothetical protein